MSCSLIGRTFPCIEETFCFGNCEENYTDAISGTESYGEWVEIGSILQHLKMQIQKKQNALAFTFVEVSVTS